MNGILVDLSSYYIYYTIWFVISDVSSSSSLSCLECISLLYTPNKLFLHYQIEILKLNLKTDKCDKVETGYDLIGSLSVKCSCLKLCNIKFLMKCNKNNV